MMDSSARSMVGSVVLGRYRIVAPLARGGMGVVYLGRLEGAAGFSKPVVIKTVIPEGKDSKVAMRLFVREALILSNLGHPSIVGVLDFGELGTDYVMVLEYVHGFHIGAWSRFVNHTRGMMPIAHAVETMLPVLDALAFAHTLTRPDGTPLDIVHRDISLANILIDNLGHVKLHDFGIARMGGDDIRAQEGTIRGTLAYAAPETLRGIAASPSSDLYGCGVVLYQLISGINPFKGASSRETVDRVLTHAPPALSSLRSDVGDKLDRVIARAMAKDPTRRFESAAELAAALRWARSWSEARVVQELVHTIQSDFNGSEMPEYLGLEPLAARDNAWRAVAGARASLSSIPPPLELAQDATFVSLTATATVRTSSADLDTVNALPWSPRFEPDLEEQAGRTPAGRTPAARSPAARTPAARTPAASVVTETASVVTEPAKARALPAPVPVEQPAPGRARSSARLVLAIAALTLLLGGGVLVGFGGRRAPAPSVAGNAGTGGAAGSELAGAFQLEAARIASCFRNNPSEVGDAPQLTVRFEIDASGAVQSAELQPPALSNSGLGACILEVARSTRFRGTGAAIRFAIPISAGS
jgi:serine/threonine-protein kinase